MEGFNISFILSLLTMTFIVVFFFLHRLIPIIEGIARKIRTSISWKTEGLGIIFFLFYVFIYLWINTNASNICVIQPSIPLRSYYTVHGIWGWRSRRSKSTTGEPRKFSALPPFPCDPKKATTLLDQWIKDWAIVLPKVIISPLVKTRRIRCSALIIEKGPRPWAMCSS